MACVAAVGVAHEDHRTAVAVVRDPCRNLFELLVLAVEVLLGVICVHVGDVYVHLNAVGEGHEIVAESLRYRGVGTCEDAAVLMVICVDIFAAERACGLACAEVEAVAESLRLASEGICAEVLRISAEALAEVEEVPSVVGDHGSDVAVRRALDVVCGACECAGDGLRLDWKLRFLRSLRLLRLLRLHDLALRELDAYRIVCACLHVTVDGDLDSSFSRCGLRGHGEEVAGLHGREDHGLSEGCELAVCGLALVCV